jgi:hypothetical protein
MNEIRLNKACGINTRHPVFYLPAVSGQCLRDITLHCINNRKSWNGVYRPSRNMKKIHKNMDIVVNYIVGVRTLFRKIQPIFYFADTCFKNTPLFLFSRTILSADSDRKITPFPRFLERSCVPYRTVKWAGRAANIDTIQDNFLYNVQTEDDMWATDWVKF